MICPSSTLSITDRSHSESFKPSVFQLAFAFILQKSTHCLSSPRDAQPLVQTVKARNDHAPIHAQLLSNLSVRLAGCHTREQSEIVDRQTTG